MDRLPLLMMAIGLSVVFLVFYPLGWLWFGSLWSASPGEEGSITLNNYVEAYSDWATLTETLGNTFVFAIGGAVLSVIAGSILAYLVVRTNTPMRGLFEFAFMIPRAIPLFVGAIAWVFLASPRTGLINRFVSQYLAFDQPLFNIFSLEGMIWVFALYETPVAFLVVAATLRSMDPSLEEAARMSGSTVLSTLFRVTLPIIRPALLSVMTLFIIIGLIAFDTPALLGIPAKIYVFTTQIYRFLEIFFPSKYGAATSLSVTLLLLCIFLVFVYRRLTRRAERFVTVTGKGFRPSTVDLGRWRWMGFLACLAYLVIAVIVPSLTVLMASFVKYYGDLTWNLNTVIPLLNFENWRGLVSEPKIIGAITNSYLLAALSATIGVMLVSFVSYFITRTKFRGRGVLEFATMFPLSLPPTVFAVGLLWAYVRSPLYATPWILVLAYITNYMPLAQRAITPAFLQIHPELEESSRSSGASWFQTFVRIVLALVKGNLVVGWVFLFLIFIRELAASILLASGDLPLVGTTIFEQYTFGQFGLLSALSTLTLLLSICIFIVVMKLFRPRFSL